MTSIDSFCHDVARHVRTIGIAASLPAGHQTGVSDAAYTKTFAGFGDQANVDVTVIGYAAVIADGTNFAPGLTPRDADDSVTLANFEAPLTSVGSGLTASARWR
jgi:hypothetical protein